MNTTTRAQTKTEPQSPVVGHSVFKKWAKPLGMVLIGLVGFYFICHYNLSKPAPIKPEIPAPTPVTNNPIAPTLPLTNQQIEKLKEVLPEINAHTHDQEEAAKMLQLRMAASSQVYSGGEGSANTESAKNSSAIHSAVLGGNGDDNSQFINQVSQTRSPTVQATSMKHISTTLLQGSVIQATLESHIDSDLPGIVRAVTSNDVYSEDDSALLLPKGTHLIGQYNSGIAQGQNRLFIVWQRAVTPQAINIPLSSPGTDPLGGAGVAADEIDHHFWQQFGTAALLSVIAAGAANVGVSSGDQYNSMAAYRSALANSFNQTAQKNLQNTGGIKPTLYIDQGTKISVLVARDLDFHHELNGAT